MIACLFLLRLSNAGVKLKKLVIMSILQRKDEGRGLKRALGCDHKVRKMVLSKEFGICYNSALLISAEPVFTVTAVLAVALPVDVDCVRMVEDLWSASLSVIHPPAVSKCLQVPDDCPVWLHVLIISAAVIVSTKPPD